MTTADKELTLLKIYRLYLAFIQATNSKQKAQRILNEFQSVLLRVIVPQLGFERANPQKKMTAPETAAAVQFLDTLPVHSIFQFREALQQGFELLESPASSQNTYGARAEKFLAWAEQQDWYPNARRERIKDQCCPPIIRRQGSAHNLRLSQRTGKYRKYALKLKDMPAQLRRECEDLIAFMTAPHYPGRTIQPLAPSSAETYLKEIERWLGYLLHHADPLVPLEDLSLSSLIPYRSATELEELSPKQQSQVWKEARNKLEALICHHFQFLIDFSESHSPSTRANRLTTLIMVLKRLYCQEVETEKEYRNHPLYKLLERYLSDALEQKREWQNNRNRTSDETKKFPEPAPGQTLLDAVLKQILEPLHLECRPRDQWGQFRVPTGIASSQQHFLQWALMSLFPARRQEEHRTLKLALSCLIDRPADLPPDGWILPLPPNSERERDSKGVVKDNFLYRTYSYNGEYYPDGVYVLDIQNYKTRSTYGSQSIPLLSQYRFADGSSFSPHLDHFLLGQWVPGGTQGTYDWWEPQFRGGTGRWATSGRMAFKPRDHYSQSSDDQTKTYMWGYVFIRPRSGTPFDASTYSYAFEVPAYRLIKKRTSPHTMRYIWATWGFQVGLSDRELEALAYSMGHTLKSLKDFYERCTPEEKRRPVEQAIQRVLSRELNKDPENLGVVNLVTLIRSAQALSLEDQQQLITVLQANQL
ncbi:hypothetical protein [Leptolyngbya sp. FACHB-17]|uniref:hypothetical protein n=1 Tax=unclassified Leptolyngbya TaxID=2650499 RepID=UPI00168143B0|nr:hypothetical protein [Leptolyngbya sp. FACHB-17]MBD2078370.1 hypothetical protein [Leptolyngbya sp. FACHB-17]